MKPPPLTGGPDAARYLAVASGLRVPRPFHLRWLLPVLCGESAWRWWSLWWLSWPLTAGGMICWRLGAGDTWQVATAAAVLLVALPGILGPPAVRPVGVDLPTTAALLWAATLWVHGWHYPALAVVLVAACAKETAPILAAVWLWSPWPLVALAAPLVAHLVRRTGPDPLGRRFDDIAAHPIRSALAAHRGRWRDAWLMVAPWGICLAALHAPSWQVGVALAVAYAQLLVATDTVRLVHHAAAPVLAAGAAATIPASWLPLALAVHVVWWRTPERI